MSVTPTVLRFSPRALPSTSPGRESEPIWQNGQIAQHFPAMGLIRKITSASTLGAVDFKSDKERIATNTKKTAKELKKARKKKD